MRAGNQGRAKGLGRGGMALRYPPEGWNSPPAHPGCPQAQPPWLCHALHDALCQTGLALGFVVWLHTVFFFTAFQANIGQKEDFEAARKKAVALGAKKVTMSLPLLPTMGVSPGVPHTQRGNRANENSLLQRFCPKAFQQHLGKGRHRLFQRSTFPPSIRNIPLLAGLHRGREQGVRGEVHLAGSSGQCPL